MPTTGGRSTGPSIEDLAAALSDTTSQKPQQVEIVKVYPKDATITSVLISNYTELALAGLAVKSLSKRFGPREFSWWDGVVIVASTARIIRAVTPDRRGVDSVMQKRASRSTRKAAAFLAEKVVDLETAVKAKMGRKPA